MLTYIAQNPVVVAAVAAIVLATISAYRTHRSIREALLALMLRAEKAYELGEFGPIAKAELLYKVVDRFIEVVLPTLPFWIRPFVTRTRLLRSGLSLYIWAKDYLDDGRFNGSTK